MFDVGQNGLTTGVQAVEFSPNEQLDTWRSVRADDGRWRGQPAAIAGHGGVAVAGFEIAGNWQFVGSPG